MWRNALLSCLFAVSGLVLPGAGAAHAYDRDGVSWSVGVAVPGVVVSAGQPGYYPPPPPPVVYSTYPPPRYYAPPPPVYYPAPGYHARAPHPHHRPNKHKHGHRHGHDRDHDERGHGGHRGGYYGGR